MADCLLIVGLPPVFDDNLLIKNKRSVIFAVSSGYELTRSQPGYRRSIANIYKNLALAFTPRSAPVVREGAIGALSFVMLVKDDRTWKRNYDLFCTIMASVHLDDWLWDPARLSHA